MKCSRGHAATPSRVCDLDATRFFHRPGTLFTFAACPVHTEPPARGYVEVPEAEYTRITTELEAKNASVSRGQG